jgi:hypothetical protein
LQELLMAICQAQCGNITSAIAITSEEKNAKRTSPQKNGANFTVICREVYDW